MTYATWEPRHRLTTVAPGKSDLFVVTLIDGKRAMVSAIVDYNDALAKARAFHRDHPCQIKVLPMTGAEVHNLFGLCAPEGPQPMTEDERRLVVSTLTQIARDSTDADARGEAFELLTRMGLMKL
ncbi:hypothetical protein [Tsuneonella rigui]|uniref:hypothetical protein n=1 Tax=Tsuneonella rigui TaxID=1708790 RepID=UPI000F7F060E|nr:hypothetical protein [Tsuneonella rigui]